MRVSSRRPARLALLTVLALACGVLPSLALAASPAAAAPTGDLIVNGSFEAPQLADNSYDIYPTGAHTVIGWMSTSPGCGLELEHHSPVTAFDGVQNVELDSNCSSTIEQVVTTTPGAAYTLSYAFSARPGVAGNHMQVQVDGDTVADPSASGVGLEDAQWQTYTQTVRASASTMRLSFGDLGPSDSLGTMLDAVSLVPVAPYTDPAAIADNTSWPNAKVLANATGTAGMLTAPGEARWYKFPVVPGSGVQVDLTGLSADADLTLYRDIGAAFTTLTSAEKDLPRLGAEFAADAFSPSIYSPSIYSPSIYSPSIYSPSIYSPSIYSPSIYSPSIYSPSIYSPSIYSPSIYSPSIYSPSIYSPSIYSPSQDFLDAFSGAQTRSLIGVSAHDGVAAESVSASTWNNTGNFYVRVQSRDGASTTPFTIRLTTTGGPCNGFTLNTGTGTALPGTSGSPSTVVLTDTARLGLTGTAKIDYIQTLQSLGGVVVDADSVARTKLLNAQADAHPQCPYAKNLVAQSLRDLVNGYRAGGALKYVVIAGGDPVVPFFRYADDAGIGPESDFVPPVRDDTASQGSLRNNFLLGQDAYGTVTDLAIKGSVLPVPDLAVGRLVETPAEITAQVQRYVANGGNLPAPRSSLVTGYDFLTSAADTVQADLKASLGDGASTLITNQGVPTTTTTVNGRPDRQHSWTADDLRNALFGSHHDLVFLAGHFSSASALAADYSTSVTTYELATHPGQFTDSLVFSAGCHSGYSLSDSEGITGLTPDLDWAQEMAQQGATLVAGTGYQYADTDFVAYSAKLYTQFAKQLRSGSAGIPVRVGQALVQAKQDYLAGVGTLTGIDTKSLLETTLYGLPMTGIDLPGRAALPGPGTGVSPQPVAAGTPGAVLGLQSATVSTSPTTTVNTRPVLGVDGAPTGANYRWLSGPDGVQTDPAIPALPKQVINATSNDGSVLRGVGFRSGSYADTPGITPLTGAPGTEHNGVHSSFGSTSFFPHRLATPNWFGALASTGDDTTRLVVTPAQYRAEASGTTATERRYGGLGLQLFYSKNIENYSGNTPALAAPPSLSQVTGTVQSNGTVAVQARVTGDPSAGIQSAWVTYTAETGDLHGSWKSVDLTQSSTDSTLWTGSFPLSNTTPADVRFLVQAVNGVGLVALDDARGDGYVPTPAGPPPTQTATTLTIGSAPTGGRYNDTVTIPVQLTGAPALSPVTVGLGALTATGVTDAGGAATIRLPLRVAPGTYVLTASYAGDATHAPSAAARTGFVVQKALTRLVYSGGTTPVPLSGDPSKVFTLTSAGVPLQGKAVLLTVLSGSGRSKFTVTQVTRRTDLFGRVNLGDLTLVPGQLGVLASFGFASDRSAADPLYAGSAAATVLKVHP